MTPLTGEGERRDPVREHISPQSPFPVSGVSGWMRCVWCLRDIWREGRWYTEGGRAYCGDTCKHAHYRWLDKARRGLGLI